MKFYHVTTTVRWNKSIKMNGLISGGQALELTEREQWQDDNEREHAGANYCPDSANSICLSLEPDMRYGDILIEINPASLDKTALRFFSSDVWDNTSRECQTLREAIRAAQDDDYDISAVEIRYSGNIPVQNLKRIS